MDFDLITICIWSVVVLLLGASNRWAAAADRCHDLQQQLQRADGRVADLLDDLRDKRAEIERLASQVSALTDMLDEAQAAAPRRRPSISWRGEEQ